MKLITIKRQLFSTMSVAIFLTLIFLNTQVFAVGMAFEDVVAEKEFPSQNLSEENEREICAYFCLKTQRPKNLRAYYKCSHQRTINGGRCQLIAVEKARDIIIKGGRH